MTELTHLTLAEARDGLKAKSFSATELAKAHIAAIEKARALNAYVLETPEKALAMAAASDEPDRQGRSGRARGASAGHQGSVLHQGRGVDRRLEHPEELQPALRIDRHAEPVERRRGDARQAQHGRVRHGLVERDQRIRPRRLAMAARGFECERGRLRRDRGDASRAGRLVWRFRFGGRGPSVPWPPRPPIRAARSASRRPSPALSASSRPMGAARAGARWRSPRRSIRRARSPAPCGIRPSCCARCRASTSRTPPAPTFRCRISRRRSREA